MINSAGLNIRNRSLRNIDPADFDRVIAANLTAAFNLLHYVVPSMRERGDGLVIQISSLSGLRASTVAGAAYSASKFGESALGLVLGREERGRNIRSTVIYPGEVDTPFLDVRAARPGGAEGKPQRREGILQPADVAAAVRFIAELPPRAHVPELGAQADDRRLQLSHARRCVRRAPATCRPSPRATPACGRRRGS
ncbi:MAG: SDR family oxidoreductase [Minicystis sp.]